MVLDQLARPLRRALDGIAVPAVGDARVELRRPLQRLEVVAQRVGTAFRVEPDRRRDPRQQVVASDEDAVAEEAEVSVGVTRCRDDLPAVDRVAVFDGLGVPRELDE